MKKTILTLLSAATLSTVVLPTVSVYATEKDTLEPDLNQSVVQEFNESSMAEENLETLDPYVEVINNKFVLSIPEDVHVDSELLQQAKMMINKSNEAIQNENLTIDPVTKTATLYDSAPVFYAYKQGVNKVTFHWNRARIYLSKTSVRNVKGGSLGALGFLSKYLPGIKTKLVASIVFGIIGTREVKGGIWFDYNYLYGVFGGTWGWQ